MAPEGDCVVYYLDIHAIDRHPRDDSEARNRCLARLARWHHATHRELAGAHGISARTVDRAVRRMADEDAAAGGRPPRGRRRSAIEDPGVLEKAGLLRQLGASLRLVAGKLGLCGETLRQYELAGLLPGTPGRARRRPRPQAAAAVDNGGVLAALPALLHAGLLRNAGLLRLPPGFFGTRAILLTLAFMLLARARNPERLGLQAARAVGLLRSRWAQENLFQYMRGEFGLDTLPQRRLEDVLAGETVVNPARRSVDRSLRKREEKLERLQRERQRIRDPRRKRKASPKAGPPDPEREAREEARLREIASGTARCEDRSRGLKTARPRLPTHVLAGDLEGEERPQALPAPLRDLLAALRILACRAETRMAGQLGPGLGSPETARALLRALFERPASLRPDPAAGTLAMRLMPMATQAQNEALARLVAEIHRSETIYPGTDLRLVYELLVEPEPPSPPLPPEGGSPSAPGTEPPPA